MIELRELKFSLVDEHNNKMTQRSFNDIEEEKFNIYETPRVQVVKAINNSRSDE